MHFVNILIIGKRHITAMNKAVITSSYVQVTKAAAYVVQTVFDKV